MSEILINLTVYNNLQTYHYGNKACQVVKLKGISDSVLDEIYYGSEPAKSLEQLREAKAKALKEHILKNEVPNDIPCLIGGTWRMFQKLVAMLPNHSLIFCP